MDGSSKLRATILNIAFKTCQGKGGFIESRDFQYEPRNQFNNNRSDYPFSPVGADCYLEDRIFPIKPINGLFLINLLYFWELLCLI